MFIDNKYTRCYNNLVRKCQEREVPSGYTEKHHIIPKSLGGNDTKENLVRLTPKEHFICHLLLPKMVEGPAVYKMVFAFFRMKKHVSSARAYDFFRIQYSKRTSGANNPMYGKKHRPEVLAKMSGAGHPMFGKHHSEEAKAKIGAKSSTRIGHLNGMFGKNRSESLKKRQSDQIGGRLGVRNPETGVQLRLKPDQLKPYLDAGWVLIVKVRSQEERSLIGRKVMVHPDGRRKMVHPSEAETLFSEGWSFFKGPGRRSKARP
jgi:hypothetical protein